MGSNPILSATWRIRQEVKPPGFQSGIGGFDSPHASPFAGLVELADTPDSKSAAFWRMGSSPIPGTNIGV